MAELVRAYESRAPPTGSTALSPGARFVNTLDDTRLVNYIDNMQRAVEELLWENRRLFRALAFAADDALRPLAIQASERALLEFLSRESVPISLSELARKRSVSRQHIHQSLHRLRNPKWVEKLPDPGDARSVLLRLSDQGRAFWKEIRAVDRTMLRRIGRQVDEDGIRNATQTLRRIRELLQGGNP